jgi:hypothetical protein
MRRRPERNEDPSEADRTAIQRKRSTFSPSSGADKAVMMSGVAI